MPHTENCEQLARAEYDGELKKYELSHDNLSIVAVLGASMSIMYNIFSTVVYQNVSGSFAQAQLGWLVLLMTTFVVAIFMVVEVLVRSDALFYLFKNHQTRFRVIALNGQAARTIGMFLVMTFLTSIWLNSWSSAHFNWLEKLCGIINVFSIINVVLLFLRK